MEPGTLAEMGASAVPSLMHALEHKHTRMRAGAQDALRRMDEYIATAVVDTVSRIRDGFETPPARVHYDDEGVTRPNGDSIVFSKSVSSGRLIASAGRIGSRIDRDIII